jgi:tetratricopeptide (TPR) repeat protein
MAAHERVESARQLHQANRLVEAEVLYSQILSEDPTNAAALDGLAVLASQTGRHAIALQLLDQAIALDPNSAQYHFDRGVILQAIGRFEEAIVSYRKSISLDPRLAGAWNNLAGALYQTGQWDPAIDASRKAIELNPDLPEAHNNLAGILRKKGLFAEAIQSARKAIALRPSFAQAHQNLADALYAAERFNESVAAFGRAIELNPDVPEAHAGLGLALYKLRRVDEAVDAYRAALKLQPDFALAHINLGLALMLKGDFPQGLREYEWRWRAPDLFRSPLKFTQARWDGSELGGGRILLFAEQGIGDTLQFVRYVPLVAARGGKVLLQAQPSLKNLLKNLSGVDQFVGDGPLPDFDVQCSLVSLPLVLGTTLSTIPADVPYLSPDRGLVERWKQRLAGKARKVGLVWAGRPENTEDRSRSLPLSSLAPLWREPGFTFYSLQKGPAASQLQSAPAEMKLIDLSPDLHDFADTAGAMAAMDLIITVDTAAAHLAGALARPVWVLISYSADWRYFLDRDDSPWYPTMRLFRQHDSGGWDRPIEEAAIALRSIDKG